MCFEITGGWQEWRDVTVHGVALSPGNHQLRIVIESTKFNLNYLDVTAESNPSQ
jgi:hypothetical protein